MPQYIGQVTIALAFSAKDDKERDEVMFHMQAKVKDGRSMLTCPACGNRQSSCAKSCIKCGQRMGNLGSELVDWHVEEEKT